MGGMLETLRNAWKIPDLRRKIFITVILLLVYRAGSFIPVPGLDTNALENLFGTGGTLLGFLDIVSGGAFKNATIFAMSITPYINATIIMQLLTIAIPRLELLAKEGEEGRKIMAQWSRYLTVVLAFLQAIGFYVMLKNAIVGGGGVIPFIIITLSFTAGTAFLMWLGEQITEYGIGNGISLIIFAGIVSRGPAGVKVLSNAYVSGALGGDVLGILAIALIIIVFIVIIAGVIWVQQAERRLPVQYAKRVVGRKMYGGQSTHIPIKVNLSGVMPIIFAMSILAFPATIVQLFFSGSTNWFARGIINSQGSWWYSLINALLIMFFTFFYTVIVFNPIEVANNLKKNGGFIPGIRPGKPTADYVSKVLNRITWFGGLFLAVITVLPSLLEVTGVKGVWFGGTAVLILVGVALDTVKQIESQMLMRHYKGFLD